MLFRSVSQSRYTWKGTLEPNELVQYVDGDGWTELDSGGLKKSAVVYGGGQFIRNSLNQVSSGTAVLSGLDFGINGQTITAKASTIPFYEPLPGCNMLSTSVNAYLGSVLRLMPVLLYNDLNMSRIKYLVSLTSSNGGRPDTRHQPQHPAQKIIRPRPTLRPVFSVFPFDPRTFYDINARLS